MASSSRQLALASISCLLLVQAVQAALPPPIYNAANIVENIEKDCPVKNVPFEPSVFDANDLLKMPEVLQNGNVSKACQDAAMNDLVYCFSDGSLQLMSGCCSKVCSTAVRKNIAAGCFAQYQEAICDNPASTKVQTGLFYAAKRCGNYEATCGPAAAAKTANATATNATATNPKTANTTAANTTAAKTTTAAVPVNTTASNATREALPAAIAANRSGEGATTTSTPAAPRNAAESHAMSTMLSFVAAVATFVLVIVC